jgi:hypothetical protein
MLDAIGVGSIEELFDRQIPAAVRLGRPLDLPAGMAEQDVYAHLRELAARNTSAEDEITFLGAGMYDHYVPAIIDMLMARSEFLTPYTPYQPEVSQGALQVMFEYQTAISELTALPVSNASVYEGPSAVAAAGYLASRPTAAAVRRLARACTRTRARRCARTRTASAPRSSRCRCATASPTRRVGRAIDGETSAVFFQQPNFYGAVEDVAALPPRQGPPRRVVVGSYDRSPLAILEPPASAASTSPSARASRWATAWTSAARRSGSSPPPRPTCAACRAHRRRDDRRRRPPRLRAHAADARAAHPPREGDVQHLHRAGAQRARRRRLPDWLGREGSSSSASCCCSARTTRARR